MTITTTNLTRAAGISAAAAGAIFIAVQIKHPAWSVTAFTDSMSWQIRSIAKLVMCGLAIAGLTGMYLHQHRRVGALGLVGFLVFAAGYFLMSSVEAIAVFVLPTLAHSEPAYVNDVLRASAGQTPAGDIGSLQTLFTLVGVLHGRRPALRHRDVPRPRPGPMGCRAAGRRHRRHRRALGPAGVLRPAVRRPDRGRPDRLGHLAVAYPAHECPGSRARSCGLGCLGACRRRKLGPPMSTGEAVRHRSWPVPAALLGLSLIPLAIAEWAIRRPAKPAPAVVPAGRTALLQTPNPPE
jgi:hypothetical protein